MLMGIKEIKEILPHRHPFLLVDCIEELVPGERAVGYKNLTYDESFFAGHFPDEPVMPGVLIVEALAQTGAVAVLCLPETKVRQLILQALTLANLKIKLFRETDSDLNARLLREKVLSEWARQRQRLTEK